MQKFAMLLVAGLGIAAVTGCNDSLSNIPIGGLSGLSGDIHGHHVLDSLLEPLDSLRHHGDTTEVRHGADDSTEVEHHGSDSTEVHHSGGSDSTEVHHSGGDDGGHHGSGGDDGGHHHGSGGSDDSTHHG